MKARRLSKEQIDEGLADLDRLCNAEYGYGIRELLADTDSSAARRLQRLTGILLKRSFAHPMPIGESHSETLARRAWTWDLDKFDDPHLIGTPEFEILNELRRDLPRQSGYGSDREPTFNDLKNEADHERGLFKVMALWLDDKLKKERGRSFREYLEAEEGARFEAILDGSTTLFQAGIGLALAPILPVPGVVVSLLLIGIRFGYRSVTDPPDLVDTRA